jgi:hypothetical protein
MDEVWQWWASTDEENYAVGPEETRDAVIRAATEEFGGETFHVIEATQGKADLTFDAARVFEDIDERNSDLVDPEGGGTIFGDKITRAQCRDLEARLSTALREWMAAHNIQPQVWTFDKTRNGEWITLAPDDQSPTAAQSS